MADDLSEWVVHHPPKSVAFGHVTNVRDPRRAWQRVQSFFNDQVDIEQGPASERTLPIPQFDPSSCHDPDMATARLKEAARRFGDPRSQERPVGAKSWVIYPSSFDAAVDFATGDEAFPEVDFGPTRFHFYRRFQWREPHAGLRPPPERLRGEIKRRTQAVGIFPNEAAIVRLVGAIQLERNDEWAVQRCRYMTLESVAPLSDNPLVSLPIMAN
jgi:hypothetical protein